MKTKIFNNSRLETVTISIEPVGDEWTANLNVMGHVLDDEGNIDHQHHMIKNYKDLSKNVQNQVLNFLKHLSKEFNIETADENSETLPDLN